MNLVRHDDCPDGRREIVCWFVLTDAIIGATNTKSAKQKFTEMANETQAAALRSIQALGKTLPASTARKVVPRKVIVSGKNSRARSRET